MKGYATFLSISTTFVINSGFSWAQGNCCWILDTIVFGPLLNEWDFGLYNVDSSAYQLLVGGVAIPPGDTPLPPDTTHLWAELHFVHENGSTWPVDQELIIDSAFFPPAGTFTIEHVEKVEVVPGFDGELKLYPADPDYDQVATIYDNCPNDYNPDQMDIDSNGVGDVCDLSCCDLAGDANNSGTVNISDAVFVINFVFVNGDDPECMDEADANGDNEVNVSDAVWVINYVFVSGSPEPICGSTGS